MCSRCAALGPCTPPSGSLESLQELTRRKRAKDATNRCEACTRDGDCVDVSICDHRVRSISANHEGGCATRLARYGARNPVPLERRTDDRTARAVTDRSDKAQGPAAGTETADPREVLARVLVHLPDTGHVTTRDDGWSANRLRGRRGQAERATADAPPPIVLLQQIFEVDPLACPTCRGPTRIIAFITEASVIDVSTPSHIVRGAVQLETERS